MSRVTRSCMFAGAMVAMTIGTGTLNAGTNASPVVGQVRPRHAREITGSMISVGAETMCRDYTVYRNWREYLGPLGAKHARIQAGWAKTEKKQGEYDWAWLDEIIPDMVAQGVKPWVCLCYGNPIYPTGGSAGAESPLPKGDALPAWENFVRAFVTRYGRHVDEWEVWNEPDHPSHRKPVDEFTDFYVRTAEAVRGVQPQARMFASGFCQFGQGFLQPLLEQVQKQGKLDLLNAITYHPYQPNPDGSYRGVEQFRKVVRTFGPNLTIYQGENGCPSTKGTYGALSGGDWTETSQAKWALRRILGDIGRGIPSSYFSIVDMHYETDGKKRMNTKGLIETNPDKTVKRVKPSYRAVQHLTAIFDDRLTLSKAIKFRIAGDKIWQEGSAWTRTNDNACVVALWEVRGNPSNDTGMTDREVTLTGCSLKSPVWVDLLSGEVRTVPETALVRGADNLVIKEVPVYDSPVLIAEKDVISLSDSVR